jgi:cell division protein FtsI (penicillin-binding protein 3)
VLFALWAIAIEARLVYLQVYQFDNLTARATMQRKRTVDVAARRGGIIDREGRTLALSVDAESLYAVPGGIGSAEKTAAALCKVLEGCGAKEQDAIVQRLAQSRKTKKQFLYLKRQMTLDETRRVMALDLEGINLFTESRRFYPNRELAAHVLGYVGTDNRGLGGIEATYDSKIRGREGTLLVETDARRHAYGRVERPPTAGATIELTIDAHLQYIAERELQAAVLEHRANGGTVIVMDPRDGEVLALANAPTFNPNTYRDYDPEHRRNRGVQEIYEPGSTFKVVTASAAMAEKVFSPDQPIDVSEGLIRLASRQIEDVHRYGVLSFTDVIVKSSNVGAIKVGTELGAERLGRYVRRFGFGTQICPDLPGESKGLLTQPANWSLSALASISMGYEIGVTPIQMVTAVSSVANAGALIQPRLVRALRRDGRRTEVEPFEPRRTIDPETVADLVTIMEQVVERGTGKSAQVPGFTVAGKTGTAAKIVDGRYSKTDYHASFVGFVPSRRPAIAVLVVIDTPRGGRYYGGEVAAPVFRRVAEQALRHLGVAPTIDAPAPVLLAQTPAAPAEGVVTAAAAGGDATLDITTGPPVIPDLRGLSAREAVRRLARLGLTAHVSGDGIVTEQDPPGGTPVDERGTCTLRLARTPAPPSSPRP